MNKSYFAGFFDGEGSIMVDSSSNRLRLVVSITSTNREVLDLFSEHYGGSIRIHTVKNRNSKPLFYWRLRDRSALSFIQNISNELLIKAKHADLAKQFMTTSDIDRKLAIAQNIKILNHRGRIKGNQLPL